MHMSSKNQRLPELTGVRGLAACWVWLFHAWLVAGSRPVRLDALGLDITPFFSGGWIGVDLFFVLSGFVLSWPYVGVQPPRFEFKQFFRRRILRVVPAYYAQFLILIAFAATGILWDLPSIGSAVAHLLFIHNLDSLWSSAVNEVWWTLPVEWQFYLVFPVLLLALSRFGGLRVLPVIVLIILSWRVGAMHWLGAYDATASISKKVWLLEQLPGRIDQFFLGMVSAHITARYAPQFEQPGRERWSLLLVIVGAVSTVALLYVLVSHVEAYWQGHWLLYIWHLWAGLALALLISGLALGGRFVRFLFGNRMMLWLGEISYSLYLWHWIVLGILIHAGLFIGVPSEVLLRVVIAYSLLPALAVSWFSCWMVERPFLHYRDPESVTSSFSAARSIFRPWPTMIAGAIMIVSIAGLGQLYWRPASDNLAFCTERGAVDHPNAINGRDSLHIVGWAYDWQREDRVRRIMITAGGKTLAETRIEHPRPDVAAAMPGCRVGDTGFSVWVAAGQIPVDAPRVEVYAERGSGRRYLIGQIPRGVGETETRSAR
jgi:peptidoglycan/LPS O-acetylase OafA/YrhL